MSSALIITNNLYNKPINAMHYGWSGSTPAAIAELQNIILYIRTNKKVNTKDKLNCLLFELSKGVDKYYKNSLKSASRILHPNLFGWRKRGVT